METTHQNRPKGAQCRRAALRRWTGWPDEEIDNLVQSGLLHPTRHTYLKKAAPNGNGKAHTRKVMGRCWFSVAEVDHLLYGD
jgi:hypothetical protein